MGKIVIPFLKNVNIFKNYIYILFKNVLNYVMKNVLNFIK